MLRCLIFWSSSNMSELHCLNPSLDTESPKWFHIFFLNLLQDILNFLHKLNPRNMKHEETYLVVISTFLRFFLTKPNNCSIGLSQGLYSALNKTFTLNFLQVVRTEECLWITALSISKITGRPRLFLSILTDRRVW